MPCPPNSCLLRHDRSTAQLASGMRQLAGAKTRYRRAHAAPLAALISSEQSLTAWASPRALYFKFQISNFKFQIEQSRPVHNHPLALALVLCQSYFDGSGGRGWTERSEGSPGVSGYRPPTPATLQSMNDTALGLHEAGGPGAEDAAQNDGQPCGKIRTQLSDRTQRETSLSDDIQHAQHARTDNHVRDQAV